MADIAGRILALDIDGCLADFTSAFTAQAQRMGKVEKAWSGYEQETWSLPFHVEPVWDAVDQAPNWWETLESLATEKDLDALNDWYAAGGAVLYVTARSGPANVAAQTTRWLWANDFPPGAVIVNVDKPALYHSLRSQIAGVLDDRPETVEACEISKLPVWVRDWPYNRNVSRDIQRVASIQQFMWQVLAREKVNA